MSEAPAISVVVPVSDARRQDLEATLRSAGSPRVALELIVVDDAAAAVPTAPAAPGQRLVPVHLRSGAGLARLRNVGLARASAPYVAFVDAGDPVAPDLLASAARALEREPAAGVAVAPAPTGTDRDSDERGWRRVRQADLARALLTMGARRFSGVLVRRALLRQIGPFDEARPGAADLDLWFRLGHCCDALWLGAGPSPCAARADADCDLFPERGDAYDCLEVLRHERRLWHDRAARVLLDRRIAACLGHIAGDDRRQHRRSRAAALYAYAFCTSPELRWLRGIARALRG